MIAPPKPALAALALGALMAATGPAAAQDRFGGQGALRDLSVGLSEITGRVEQAVSTTMATREDFASHVTDERSRVVIEALCEQEPEFRAILELLNPTSPMMDAINDARADVLVMLRRADREEPSAERDARPAEFTRTLAGIEDQVGQIRAADAPRRPRAPCSGDLVSNPMSMATHAPQLPPVFTT